MFEAITCAIPGAKRPGQVEENCRAADLPVIPGGSCNDCDIYTKHSRKGTSILVIQSMALTKRGIIRAS
jgi:hypothetical protein